MYVDHRMKYRVNSAIKIQQRFRSRSSTPNKAKASPQAHNSDGPLVADAKWSEVFLCRGHTDIQQCARRNVSR